MPNDATAAKANFSPTYFPGVIANADWIRPFTDAPAKFYASVCKEALNLTARHLQTQTDYVRQLSQCDTPLDLITCNGEFLQKTAATWMRDVEDAFEALRRSSSTSSASSASASS
jgi:hypothetical protein